MENIENASNCCVDDTENMKWIEFIPKHRMDAAEKKGNTSHQTEKFILTEKSQNDQNKPDDCENNDQKQALIDFDKNTDKADSENVNLEVKNDGDTAGKKLNKRKKNNKKTGDKRKALKKKKAIIGVNTKEPEHAVVGNKPNLDMSVANFGNEVNQGASTSGIHGPKQQKKLSKKQERKRQEELALDEAYMNYFLMEARADRQKILLVAVFLAFLDDLGISIRI